MQKVIQISHLLFLLLFLSLPLSKGVTSVAVGGLLILSSWKLLRKQIASPRAKDFALLSPAWVFIALLLSLFYSDNLERGFQHIYRQNALLVFPFFFFAFQDLVRSKWQQYARVFIFANLIAALLTLLFSFISPESLQKITQQIPLLKDFTPQHKQTAFGAYSPFLDRLHFGYLLGIALLLQIRQCLTKEHLWQQLLILAILISAFAILGARGAQLAFLFSLIVWIGYAYNRWFRPIIQQKLGKPITNMLLLLAIFMIVVGLPYAAYRNIPAISERYNQLIWEVKIFQADDLESYSYVHFTSIRRIMSWSNTWELIQHKPLLGVGIGDYEDNLSEIYARTKLDFPVNSHHQFLYYWAAGGLLAVFAFSLTYLLFLWQVWNNQQGLDSILGIAFWCFYLVVFMLDVPLIYQAGNTGFFAFFALFLLMPDKS